MDHGQHAALSPNQLDKRRRITEGAKAVILRDGLRACTTRAIAKQTGSSAGQIHYYFATVSEIVDAVMLECLDEIVQRVRSVETTEQGADRLNAVVQAHGALFHETPGLLSAWLEYLTTTTREGRTEPMVHVYDTLLEAFTDALRLADASHPEDRARVLLAASIGQLIADELRPAPADASQTALLAVIQDATPADGPP